MTGMRKATLVGLVVVTSIVTSVITVAAVDFSDTSTSPFATEIDNITDAGCASGFPDDTFRPQDLVKRQQFAYWLDNCGSRSAEGDGSATGSPIGGMPADLEDATITVGGAPDQHQYLLVIASFNVTGPPSGVTCPCRIEGSLQLENLSTMGSVGDGVATATTGGSNAQATVTVFQRFTVDTATSYRAKIAGFVVETASGGCAASCLTVSRADVMLWTAPFNEVGGAGPS